MRRLFAILLAAALTGCDLGDPGVHSPEPVVEAWLIAGEEFPPIRLTWTQSVEVSYGSVPVGIEGANVSVSLLDGTGQPARTVAYMHGGGEDGWYVPDISPMESLANFVVPGATYVLEAVVPGFNEPVRATTVVPGDFDVRGVPNETVVYQSTNQVEIDVTQSFYPERDAVYVITMEAKEPSFDNLTPFIRDALYGLSEGEAFDPDEIDFTELEDNIRVSSPPLNEANWEVNLDGSLKLRLPWFFVSFYGVNEVTVAAIDDNIWNFLLGVNAQEGNGGLAPGEIPAVDAGVTGGQGLFGSLTREVRRVTVTEE
ncbi:MAG: DUF4249 family protein [Rhodothermales bacterium]|nr:DUF4249 family protein [Rhodothermales bacterium]MBO6780412.1 DUF4249 family protein [Rhodothermales bacterium]